MSDAVEVALRLARRLGEDRVSTDPERLQDASRDLTEIVGTAPDCIVRVRSREEIQAVLEVARDGGTPVTPVVANTNVGGLALPSAGGILLDLSGMNRILEVNAADSYAVIEPGVTWQDLHDHLERHHPELRFSYPLAPPDSSALAGALMDGINNLALRLGTSSDNLQGLEVVLASGEVVRTGIWAVEGCPPVTRAPLPDLTGLFLDVYGTTGIVTRGVVGLWPRHPHRYRCFLLADAGPDAFDLLRRLATDEICDDLAVLSYPAGKMLLGSPDPGYRRADEPEYLIYADLSGAWDKLLDLKKARLRSQVQAVEAERGVALDGPLALEDLIRLEPGFRSFASFPTRLTFLLDHPGGGLSWVGTFGPTSGFSRVTAEGCAVMRQMGWPPCVVTRPMWGGHYGIVRFLAVFDRNDPDACARVSQVNLQVTEVCLRNGFFPYKTPAWVLNMVRERIDPGLRRLFGQVRQLMDPEGILNPGQWQV